MTIRLELDLPGGLMDKAAIISRVLDAAVAKAVESEFGRCTRGMTTAEKRQWVSKARDSLDLLRSLESPDYADKMVTLLYVVRYQVSHINLAYSVIEAINGRPEDDSLDRFASGLHVVDFGCGALAMQFGVALMIADALERGHRVSEIRIDSIDTSGNMLDIGLKIWAEFVSLISRDARLSALREACSLIQANFATHTDCGSIQKFSGALTWISALHIVYKSNRNEVRNALSSLREAVAPKTALMTCYGDSRNPGNIPLLKDVSPFGGAYRLTQLSSSQVAPKLDKRIPNSLVMKFAGKCGYVSPYRRDLYCDWPSATTAFIYIAKEGGSQPIDWILLALRRLFRRIFVGDGANVA